MIGGAPEPRRCPCGSGSGYPDCCGRLHRGEATAGTAEQLMRSRYSAFAVGDAAYLLETWHPSQRPAELSLDEDTVWRHLTIEETSGGGPFDREGVVQFAAVYRDAGGRGVMRERSRFVREDRWTYLDGAQLG